MAQHANLTKNTGIKVYFITLLLLPLAHRNATPPSFLTSGVLSGPKGFASCLVPQVIGKLARQSGFVVETQAAIAVREISNPETAAWWRENTPHLLRGKRYFVFHENVGRVVETCPLQETSNSITGSRCAVFACITHGKSCCNASYIKTDCRSGLALRSLSRST